MESWINIILWLLGSIQRVGWRVIIFGRSPQFLVITLHTHHPSRTTWPAEGRGMGQVSRKTVWVHQILSLFLHWISFYCVCFLSSGQLEDVSIYPLEAFTTEDHGPKFQNSDPWGLESKYNKIQTSDSGRSQRQSQLFDPLFIKFQFLS